MKIGFLKFGIYNVGVWFISGVSYWNWDFSNLGSIMSECGSFRVSFWKWDFSNLGSITSRCGLFHTTLSFFFFSQYKSDSDKIQISANLTFHSPSLSHHFFTLVCKLNSTKMDSVRSSHLFGRKWTNDVDLVDVVLHRIIHLHHSCIFVRILTNSTSQLFAS